MPNFVGRSAGLLTQPSTHDLKFRSPVPSNPMLIPSFIQREIAPLRHTHSQGDITGAGAGASAARRGIFISIGPEVATAPSSMKVYFEVRDGKSLRASESWIIEAYTDDTANPPVLPRGTAISAASVDTGKGTFYASIEATLANRARDFLFKTTTAGSARVTYFQSNNPAALSVILGAILVGPEKDGGPMVFTA